MGGETVSFLLLGYPETRHLIYTYNVSHYHKFRGSRQPKRFNQTKLAYRSKRKYKPYSKVGQTPKTHDLQSHPLMIDALA